MSYIPATQTFLDVSNSTSDQIWSNRRQVANGVNHFTTDGGAGSSLTLKTLTTTTRTATAITLLTSDNTSQFCDSGSGNVTLTLPAATASADKVFAVKKTSADANTVTLSRASTADSIDGAASVVLSNQYDWVIVQSDGTAVWKVIGRTVPSSGVAPADAQYLTLASNSTLTQERTFTPGNNIFATDGGANSTYTVQIFQRTNISNGTTNLTSSSNTVQIADCTSGTATVNLPAVADNKVFVIKKKDSSANTVVINRAGSDTIDGATSQTLTIQYQSISLVGDSTDTAWYIF